MREIHSDTKKTMNRQDQEDLARFRAALAKLNTCQKREVIGQMLGKPDTP